MKQYFPKRQGLEPTSNPLRFIAELHILDASLAPHDSCVDCVPWDRKIWRSWFQQCWHKWIGHVNHVIFQGDVNIRWVSRINDGNITWYAIMMVEIMIIHIIIHNDYHPPSWDDPLNYRIAIMMFDELGWRAAAKEGGLHGPHQLPVVFFKGRVFQGAFFFHPREFKGHLIMATIDHEIYWLV